MGAKLLPLTKDETSSVGKIWEDAERLGKPFTWMQRSKITGGFIGSAIAFMDKSIKKNKKPFYVDVWPDDVHSPYWSPYEEYGVAKKSGKRGLYLAVLEAMDQQFGKLFDYIQNNEELRDNTLVLLCSDNGPELGAGQAGNLKGYKTHLFEGGIRSSLIVWGPGFIKKKAQGTRNQSSCFSAIDIAPSLLDFANVANDTNAICDGECMIKTILGESKQSRQAPIFYSRPPDRKNYYNFQNLPDLAMRHEDWKLLCDYDGSRPQLYNIINDPSESNNLTNQYPDKVQQMVNDVTGWYQSMPVLAETINNP